MNMFMLMHQMHLEDTYPEEIFKNKEKNLQKLKKSNNPFATVTLASIKTYEKNEYTLYHWKTILTKMLYEKGYTYNDIMDLYDFIDGIMTLPEDLEIRYNETISKYEEVKKMPYINTAQRIGRKEGKKEVAINALKMGLDIEQISQLTKLNHTEIMELQDNLVKK